LIGFINNLDYSQKNFFTAENAEYTEKTLNKNKKTYFDILKFKKLQKYYYFISANSATSAVKFIN